MTHPAVQLLVPDDLPDALLLRLAATLLDPAQPITITGEQLARIRRELLDWADMATAINYLPESGEHREEL